MQAQHGRVAVDGQQGFGEGVVVPGGRAEDEAGAGAGDEGECLLLGFVRGGGQREGVK